MTINEKIFACLTDPTSNTYALVASRVYPDEGRQGEQTSGSYVVYQEIAGDPKETHGTPSDAEDSLDGTLYQFSCYAATRALAHALRLAVRLDLLVPEAMDDVKVTSPVQRSGDEPEIKLKRADLDLVLFHNPTTA